MPQGVYIRTKKIVSPMKGKKHSLQTRKKMSVSMQGKGINGASKRWEGHTSKPRKPLLGLWKNSRDPLVQLEKKRFRNQRYKARKNQAEDSHTFDEWLLLKAFYKYICLCCKRSEPEIKLSEDHIIPLSMGGTDSIDNIQPLCISCNTRKSAKHVDYRLQLTTKGGEYKFS